MKCKIIENLNINLAPQIPKKKKNIYIYIYIKDVDSISVRILTFFEVLWEFNASFFFNKSRVLTFFEVP